LGDCDDMLEGAPVTVGLMLGWLDGREDTDDWLGRSVLGTHVKELADIIT